MGSPGRALSRNGERRGPPTFGDKSSRSPYRNPKLTHLQVLHSEELLEKAATLSSRLVMGFLWMLPGYHSDLRPVRRVHRQVMTAETAHVLR